MKDTVICNFCNKHFKMLTESHLKQHGSSCKDYRIKFPMALFKSEKLNLQLSTNRKGKSWEEIIGKEKADLLKNKAKERTKTQWKTCSYNLKLKQNAQQICKNKNIIKEEKKLKLEKLKKEFPFSKRISLDETMQKGKCITCSKQFLYYIKESSGKFCSRKCFYIYRNNNKKITPYNYRKVALAQNQQKCQRCSAIETKLHVHHKDGNALNNELENLILVCPKCHNKIHRELQKVYNNNISIQGIKRGAAEIVKALKLNLTDPNFKDTPDRVARMYTELLEGSFPEAEKELEELLLTTFPCEYDEMVIIKNTRCWGMCPHHFLPVSYSINIAYFPDKKVIGLSKIPRIAILLAKRPVLQEQLTKDISDVLTEILSPKGVAVSVTGEHLCMKIRGAKQNETNVITSSVTGIFREDSSTKSEFLKLCECY